jgi:hypothetical protein
LQAVTNAGSATSNRITAGGFNTTISANNTQAISASVTGNYSTGLTSNLNGNNSLGILNKTEGVNSHALMNETNGMTAIGCYNRTFGMASSGTVNETHGEYSDACSSVALGNFSAGMVAETHGMEAIGCKSLTNGSSSHGFYSETQGVGSIPFYGISGNCDTVLLLQDANNSTCFQVNKNGSIYAANMPVMATSASTILVDSAGWIFRYPLSGILSNLTSQTSKDQKIDNVNSLANYEMLVIPLTDALNEQKARIEKQDEKIKELEKMIGLQEQLIEKMLKQKDSEKVVNAGINK